MSFLFYAVMILIAYQLTVNTRNRREIKNLRNQVSEFEQRLNLILVYGKEKRAEKETFEEEERQVENQGLNAGESTT